MDSPAVAYFKRLLPYSVDARRARDCQVLNTRGSCSIGLKFKEVVVEGNAYVMVTGVNGGSECCKAGVPQGILRSIDGVMMRSCGDVLGAISGAKNEYISITVIPFPLQEEDYYLEVPERAGDAIGAEFLSSENGVIVVQVFPNTPAARAGLGNAIGKRVLRINDHTTVMAKEDFDLEILRARASGSLTMKLTLEGAASIPSIFKPPQVADAKGYIWVDVPGEVKALTLQPHHLLAEDGTPLTGYTPAIGDVVQIYNLFSPEEVRYNGAKGRIIPPGEVEETECDDASTCKTSTSNFYAQPVKQYPPPAQKKEAIRPQVMGDNTVFRSMLRSPNARATPQAKPKTDWQQWIRIQNKRAAAAAAYEQ
eukprot:TRINITY_DN10905_c0_g1_i2.p1 TRINITY_DN10905_c0_g1~~TRINITY_DN10905_c0_g1_i2.p1  ORF type:complete len:381 (+),score=72.41 TRINITY_DN10905_c0_g1_i2:47-1144(+)